ARPAGRRRGQAPGLRASPGATALRRTATAISAWLRRPLTSLHLILGVFGLLTLFGLVMVLSASSVESYAADGSSYSVFVKQLMFSVVGLVLFWVGLRIPPPKLRALCVPVHPSAEAAGAGRADAAGRRRGAGCRAHPGDRGAARGFAILVRVRVV